MSAGILARSMPVADSMLAAGVSIANVPATAQLAVDI